MRLKRFLTYQFPFLLWVICIFGLSSIPNIPSVKSPVSLDKIAHIGMFLILSWLSWRAFHFQDRIGWLRKHALLYGVLFAGFYGSVNEVYQMSLPGRSADVYDAVANFVGAGVFFLWQRYHHRHRRHAGK